MHPPDSRLQFERPLLRLGLRRIAGLDEAGRGPLAGPVVAAAVILPRCWLENGLPGELRALNDSKQLSGEQRALFHARLTSDPDVAVAFAAVDAAEIDATNILRATHRAMVAALAQFEPAPDHVLVDGLLVRSLALPQTPVVHGDARSYSIAAASVVAKVTRDRLMEHYDRQFPGYGFARHKGYGTPDHLEALRHLGPCPIHRRSFAPLKPVQGALFET